MEQARSKVFTKHISAVVSPDDYDYLKKTSESYSISLGDFIRGIIKEYKEKEELNKQQ